MEAMLDGIVCLGTAFAVFLVGCVAWTLLVVALNRGLPVDLDEREGEP